MLVSCDSSAQLLSKKEKFTRQDSLRGTLNEYRTWWDVIKYDITVAPDYDSKTISGNVVITYNENEPGHTMQIDMQEPMIIDSAIQENRALEIRREGNVYWVTVRDSLKKIPIPQLKKR